MKPLLDREGDRAKADELVEELASNTTDAIKAQRQSVRLDIRVAVMIEPASLSARDGHKLQGVTGDVSVGGMQILLPKPLNIGDVYQASFNRNELDLPPVFAICLRGRQVRPDAFEAGLRFLEPVQLPQQSTPPKNDLL